MEKHKLLSLVKPEDLHEVNHMFKEAIKLSFLTHIQLVITTAELRRRFNLCYKIFETLVGDMKWPLAKVKDFLPTYLKCEIDGVPYHPETVKDRWGGNVAEQIHDVPKTPEYYDPSKIELPDMEG